jgi:RNA polymerase sigma-70 factor (ECF subfamily)
MKEQEQIIIESILAGQIDQYRILVGKYQNPVFRLIMKIVGNYDDAKDLTQDVFVKAFESMKQYKPQYKFFSWIYRIAINEALLFVKRKRNFRQIESVTDPACHLPDQTPDYENREKLLNNAINDLAESYKSVILLKYYSDLSYTEMAETLSLPEKTVKSRLFDARKMLREKLINNDFFTVVQNN